MTRSVSIACLGCACFLLSSFLAFGPEGGTASARQPKEIQRYLVQILIQTPRRFSVPNVKVMANGQLLGATDKFGIFVGFLSGYVGQKVQITVQKSDVGLQSQRTTRLRTKTTGTAILPTPIKMRFQLKGAKSADGKMLSFPIRVFALTPDRVGISKAKVMIDGKYVGRTNKFGLWVGRFKSQVDEVIQIKVVGRGTDNQASLPARLRLNRNRRPAVVKFHAYIRP